MQAEDFISLPDILRAVALLRNANVPMIKDRYACVIDSAGIQQLALGDSRFGDRVEAFKDSKQRVLSAGDTIDYAGVLFKVQSDPYRCHLPGAGGELRVRKNAGKVRVCHIFGENAWGYLDLGEAGSKQRQLTHPHTHTLTHPHTHTHSHTNRPPLLTPPLPAPYRPLQKSVGSGWR
jgi:hypothetical protein